MKKSIIAMILASVLLFSDLGLYFCEGAIVQAAEHTKHTWEKKYTVDKAATMKAAGSKSYHCSVCDAKKAGSSVTIPKIKSVTLSDTKLTYNGSIRKPSVLVKDSKGKAISSSNYTVTYEEGRKHVGTYEVTIKFKGSYSGTVTRTFEIVKAAQKISASAKTMTVGMSGAALGAERTTGNGKLTYTSSDKNIVTVTSTGKLTAKAVGKATVTITAAGTSNYKKTTKKVTVTVKPKGTVLKSVVSLKNGQLTVKWAKRSAATGYQIRYSAASDMSNATSVRISGNDSVSKTFSGLAEGQTYYVQIRTYKTVSGVRYYSFWSDTETVSTLNVKLNKTSAYLIQGKKTTLKMSGADAAVTWKSSDTAVATVSTTGVVTGKKAGTATITATVGSQKFTCDVVILSPTLDVKTTFPSTFVYEVDGEVRTKTQITGCKTVFEPYLNTGNVSLTIKVDGKKVYEILGDEGKTICNVAYQLYDADTGILVDAGVISTRDAATGETFVMKEKIANIPEGNYYLILGDDRVDRNQLRQKMIDVSVINQYPELPTGCESVAATMVLQYHNVDVSAETFAGSWLECSTDFYTVDDKMYGPNPDEVFAGNPFSEYSYGCFATPIVKAINNNCKTHEAKKITNKTLEELCDEYIDNNEPILIWATMGMKASKEGRSWYFEDGTKFTWIAGEHCLVLVGYNEEYYFLNDPQIGSTVGYKKELVEQRFEELGTQAVYVYEK